MDMVNTLRDDERDGTVDSGLPPIETPRTIFGVRASAWLEMLVFLAGLLVVDTLWGGGERFLTTSPHPFWIIVLLIAVQYGAFPGLIAAVASSLALVVGNQAVSMASWMTPEVLDNPAMLNPVLWVIAAVILGEVRQRHIREKTRLESQLREAVQREAVTAGAYDELRIRKQRLEERIAGEMHSALTVFRAAKSLETMSPAQILRAVEQVVADLLGAKAFSLFLLKDNHLDAAMTAGWDTQTTWPRRYASSSSLYQTVVGKRELLTVASREHEQTLGGEGVLAAPIISPVGEVLGMLKIESLPFTRFGIHTVGTLKGIADWTATALANATHFEQALEQAVQNPENQLMTSSYFERYTAFVTALGKRAKFPVSMVGVGMNLPGDLAESEQVNIARSVADAVRDSLRTVDFAFDYQRDGSGYSIILPTTSREGAEIVREKITASLEQKLSARNLRYPFSTTVQELAA